jgi:hypothetical protein
MPDLSKRNDISSLEIHILAITANLIRHFADSRFPTNVSVFYAVCRYIFDRLFLCKSLHFLQSLHTIDHPLKKQFRAKIKTNHFSFVSFHKSHVTKRGK